MEVAQKACVKRSSSDRRVRLNRRIINLGPTYPMAAERRRLGERRSAGWQGRRCGWFRTSRWISSPPTPS